MSNKFHETSTKIRNGLFLASSRTYAEQYVEPFIRFELGLTSPESNDHDGVDKMGIKYEIKASKVLSPTYNLDKSKSIYERIMFENTNLEINRLVSFSHAETAEYGANIQNVKRDHFKFLIYVLLFEDCIKVFKIENSHISKIPNWSDKHGRYDQLGKSGQFPINKGNIDWHISKYLTHTFNYDHIASVTQELY